MQRAWAPRTYYDWPGAEQAWKDAAIVPVIPESTLLATLGILARTVAPGKLRPALNPMTDIPGYRRRAANAE